MLQETRGGRGFDSLIVDEVDHLTLDSCLSLTYLSHQAPGMHHLNSVYGVIWQMVTAVLPPSSLFLSFVNTYDGVLIKILI